MSFKFAEVCSNYVSDCGSDDADFEESFVKEIKRFLKNKMGNVKRVFGKINLKLCLREKNSVEFLQAYHML